MADANQGTSKGVNTDDNKEVEQQAPEEGTDIKTTLAEKAIGIIASSTRKKAKDTQKAEAYKGEHEKIGADLSEKVDIAKEAMETFDAQEKLNDLVIMLWAKYSEKLNRIEGHWDKIPEFAQAAIVKGGPLAGVLSPFPPLSMAATAALSFLVKTGLLSYKGEIKDGVIDLEKSISIGKGTKKLTKLIVKGLEAFFEECEGLEAIVEPALDGAQYFDKTCANAKENFYKHLNEEAIARGEEPPYKIKPSQFSDDYKKAA